MSLVYRIISNKVPISSDAHVVDINKSNGSWFCDAVTGKRYLDCFSQYASQPLGWNNEKLLQRMSDVPVEVLSHKIANSDIHSNAYADFCAIFDDWTPDFKYHFFICGGTLGVENAIKAACDYTAQRLGLTDDESNNMDIIHLKQAFHGRSGYTLSLTNTDPIKTNLYPKFPWTRIHNPKLKFPLNLNDHEGEEMLSLNQTENALARGKVAAIIMEPIQGEGGDNHFSKRYIRAMRHLATQYDAMFILDEVQTGMGMTGETWCYQHFDIVPDMICFGKKSQVCGFACTDKIDKITGNVFKTPSRINSTWGGNIVDMVRSTIFMQIIEEDNLICNAEVVGSYFKTRLLEVGSPLTNVRGRGLMLAFDLPDNDQRDRFLNRLKEKMLVIKCGEKSIRLRPAMTFSNDDVDTAVEMVKWARDKM